MFPGAQPKPVGLSAVEQGRKCAALVLVGITREGTLAGRPIHWVKSATVVTSR
jgi:hypothetical protein